MERRILLNKDIEMIDTADQRNTLPQKVRNLCRGIRHKTKRSLYIALLALSAITTLPGCGGKKTTKIDPAIESSIGGIDELTSAQVDSLDEIYKGSKITDDLLNIGPVTITTSDGETKKNNIKWNYEIAYFGFGKANDNQKIWYNKEEGKLVIQGAQVPSILTLEFQDPSGESDAWGPDVIAKPIEDVINFFTSVEASQRRDAINNEITKRKGPDAEKQFIRERLEDIGSSMKDQIIAYYKNTWSFGEAKIAFIPLKGWNEGEKKRERKQLVVELKDDEITSEVLTSPV